MLPRAIQAVAACCLLAAVATASPPARPGPGASRNFYLLGGVESLAYRLDPRGAVGFVDAGLDVVGTDPQVLVGVGWVFVRPVRLDLLAGGGQVEVARPGMDVGLGRAVAGLHLALIERRRLVLEGTLSVGFHGLVYQGAEDDKVVPGSEVGLGATLRLDLPGPFALHTAYRWQQARFQRTSIELDPETVVDVHPTATFHGVRVLLSWDL